MNNGKRDFRAISLYTAILSQLTGSILFGVFAGLWLDSEAGTTPLFLVIGVLLGVSAGVIAMLHTIRKYESGD